MIKKTIRKLKSSKGMSLGEVLLCVLIIMLVTSTLATGISLAYTNYRISVTTSEAKILYSTLKSVILSELGNTNAVFLKKTTEGTEYPLDKFFSRTYAITDEYSRFYSVTIEKSGMEEPDDGYGEIILGTEDEKGVITGNLLISRAAYSSYHLSAKVDVTYDININTFHVTLSISNKNDIEISESFDVIPLNEMEIEIES